MRRPTTLPCGMLRASLLRDQGADIDPLLIVREADALAFPHDLDEEPNDYVGPQLPDVALKVVSMLNYMGVA